jgi:hypothetical protein
MHILDFILVSFYDNIASRKDTESSSVQINVDGVHVHTDLKAEIYKVTSLVSASGYGFYGSHNEHEEYKNNVKKLDKKSNGVIEIGIVTVQTVEVLGTAKKTARNVVEACSRQEILHVLVYLYSINETAEKLADATLSEVDTDEPDTYELFGLLEDSTNDAVHPDDPEIPEVLKMEHHVPTEQKENGVHHTQNLSTKMDLIVKKEEEEEVTPKSGKTGASMKGSVSPVRRSVASIQQSSEKLLQLKKAVERAIRVSNILHRQRKF